MTEYEIEKIENRRKELKRHFNTIYRPNECTVMGTHFPKGIDNPAVFVVRFADGVIRF